MKFKNAIISLSLLGGLLPQASFGMDPVVDVPGGTVSRRPSIIIPSDPDIVGMKEIEFPAPEMKRSWKNLNSFTSPGRDMLRSFFRRYYGSDRLFYKKLEFAPSS
jgi:hypothetical protein